MPFLYVGAVLHATVIGVIAFFILFAAEKATGFTALLGRLLGYWVLLIAIGALAIGVMHAMSGKPMGPWMHDHWDHMRPPPPEQTAPATKPAPAPAPKSTPAKP
jgi:hypothetical protein